MTEVGCEKIGRTCTDCGLTFVQRRYPSIVFRPWIRCAHCTAQLWAARMRGFRFVTRRAA